MVAFDWVVPSQPRVLVKWTSWLRPRSHWLPSLSYLERYVCRGLQRLHHTGRQWRACRVVSTSPWPAFHPSRLRASRATDTNQIQSFDQSTFSEGTSAWGFTGWPRHQIPSEPTDIIQYSLCIRRNHAYSWSYSFKVQFWTTSKVWWTEPRTCEHSSGATKVNELVLTQEVSQITPRL